MVLGSWRYFQGFQLLKANLKISYMIQHYDVITLKVSMWNPILENFKIIQHLVWASLKHLRVNSVL